MDVLNRVSAVMEYGACTWEWCVPTGQEKGWFSGRLPFSSQCKAIALASFYKASVLHARVDWVALVTRAPGDAASPLSCKMMGESDGAPCLGNIIYSKSLF